MAKRLPAGYRERPQGGYECRFTVDGKRYSVYGETLKECQQHEQEKRDSIKEGLANRRKSITLDGYYKEWIEMKSMSIKGNTALNIKGRYKKHIKPILGHRKMIELERRDIIALQKVLSKTQKATSANTIMAQLRSMLNDAVRDGILYKSPADGVKTLKSHEKQATESYHRALTEEEQKLFMQEAKKEFLYEFLALMLCTGMRVGEVSALEWRDIDYTNNVIHVTKTVSRTKDGAFTVGTPKSKQGFRDIPMNDGIKSILKSQKEKQAMLHGNIVQLNGTVFEGLFGGMVYNAVANKAIRDTLERLRQQGKEIEHFSTHALRDTFATRYIEQGGTPQTLKTILGHSSLSMTMDLYSHVLPNTKQKEMDNVKIAF